MTKYVCVSNNGIPKCYPKLTPEQIAASVKRQKEANKSFWSKIITVRAATDTALWGCGHRVVVEGDDAGAEAGVKNDTIPPDSLPDAPKKCSYTGRTLNVPTTQHPTVLAAINASQTGDTIQVAAGNYSTIHAKMPYCTRLVGAGKNRTFIEYKITSPPSVPDYILSASDQCTISSLTVRDLPSFQDFPFCGSPYFGALGLEEGTVTIKDSAISCLRVLKRATPLISSNEIHTLVVHDQAKPNLQNNAIVGAWYWKDAAGQLTNNKFISPYGGATFSGSSTPILRGNTFGIINYPGPYNHIGVRVNDTAKPDLGTSQNPGNNLFNNQSSSGKYFAFSIDNTTSSNIPAYGNYFEQKPNPGGSIFSTYDEMVKYPDPFGAASNITSINDSHDDPKFGTVDYRGFKKIK